MEQFLTPKQVAEMWNCAEATVRRLCEKGIIESINVGTGKRKHYRIPLSSLQVQKGDDAPCPILESFGA